MSTTVSKQNEVVYVAQSTIHVNAKEEGFIGGDGI